MNIKSLTKPQMTTKLAIHRKKEKEFVQVTRIESTKHNIMYMFRNIPREIFIYIVCVVIHFGAPYVYIELCIPNTFRGFIMSQFMVMTPQCQLLRHSIYYSGYILSHLWILFGTYLLRELFTFSNLSNLIK